MTLKELYFQQEFVHRHLGSNDADQKSMLNTLGAKDLDAFIESTVPSTVRMHQPLDLPEPLSESEALEKLRQMADNIQIKRSFYGLGYYPTHLPNVILRNVFENPGWYTAYTPYQPEIAQGRLEALLNFQQMCIDLTGLEMANASLLDEATAAAEAMTMVRRISKSSSNAFFVDARIFPQTADVIKTRAKYFGFDVVIGDIKTADQGDYFGAIFQYAGTDGDVIDLTDIIAKVKSKGALAIVAADIMGLVLLKSPAEMGADVALGSAQRFGIPMGFGGPHAAYFAFKEEHKRSVAGRIIGVSVDSAGKPALRMALQTREQHIRREKANSNICTSQVLLANLAGMYATYHGPEGLKRIAQRIHTLAAIFADKLTQKGLKIVHQTFFDTVLVETKGQAKTLLKNADLAGYQLRAVDENRLSVAFNEEATIEDLTQLIAIFTGDQVDEKSLQNIVKKALSSKLLRQDAILTHPVFHLYHQEHEMLRYLKRLENKDLSLTHSMISLGSCTMKLNATSEMIPVTWPAFSQIHPFAPREQVQGYLALIDALSAQLKAITGFDEICMQPNSGAQGEYTGMLLIRRYHESRGQAHRDVCLIPRSAHGTNPATAQMLGLNVVVVSCDEQGNVDLVDLKAKAEQYHDKLAALMITYPSTHGVFEAAIREICDIIHSHGGQVYMDGANMNAQVGLMQPSELGADVLHMNLHKTFCIPHGGGGPGMGPIGLKKHLIPFMPNNVVAPIEGNALGMGAVSAAPFGSASILPITWMYITMMGGQGLTQATKLAILNANYIAHGLKNHYPILYTGQNGRVAHECIVDLRPIKAESGISEVDIAKRLMDFGFHPPTMSFPVAGTLMIEPTESESQAELDRFIHAMIQIKMEIDKVQSGEWSKEDNPLVKAPHTHADIAQSDWSRPYSREAGVYPLPFVKRNKFWPSVNRIDDAYGDRNLVCTCPSPEEYT